LHDDPRDRRGGFIGLNVLRRLLLSTDCEIRVLDDFSNSLSERVEHVARLYPGAARRLQVIRGDIVDVEPLRKAMADVDTVIHLDAQTGVGSSIADLKQT
jgi:nucleoside-diphosphate-sugar epimerase